MDHSATTPVDPKVVEAMVPYFSEKFGNASSLHSFGREAFEAVQESRRKVAELIGASPEEVIFTGGGTESDNLAVVGSARKMKQKGRDHVIASRIEHPAVLEACRSLEGEGFEVTYLEVDKDGLVSPEDVRRAITEKTALVTVMHANNEIGTIEPIEEIGEITAERGVVFHTDAVQSAGKIPVDVKRMNVDMLSLSAHKIYGPKGVGALYVRKGTPLQPLIHGGGHERGFRSGTENVAGIVGMGKSAELARARLEEDSKRLTALRDELIERVLQGVSESYLNGHATKRLPNNAHFRFSGIEGESLILELDEKGVAASTGSACSSKKLEPSHVLMAIGLNEVEAHGSLRLTLGHENTEEDVEYVVECLEEAVGKLRSISPMWNKGA
ncbi:MAG: cysteine desulfurase NifS [Candidatus Brockarchaeota archaeon]|nr:cysteine desulfurase NifS [Candidatus Brockarchaeota archaeon]